MIGLSTTLSLSKIETIFALLSENYAQAKIELDYETPYQLLIAVVLSAQSTDRSVNKVTKNLFSILRSPNDLSSFSLEELQSQIASLGLYKTKAYALKKLSEQLIENHKGQVPSTFEELIALQGVGRKTAHVILNELYHHPVIAVDTHVFRVSQRLGLSLRKNRDHLGDELMEITPKIYTPKAHHLLIFLGRRLCLAKKPKCSECFLRFLCPSVTTN